MSDITCPNCSATLPAGASFCTSCGQRMEAAPPAPPVEDATRVESPGLHDSTQVIPPAPAAAAGAWQPSESSAPPAPAAPTEPAAAPWSQPGAPAAPPAAEPPAWEQPAAAQPQQPWQTPPQQQVPPTWGAPQQGAPGAPAWGEPAKAASVDQPSPVGGLVSVAGAALVLVGLFLSWFTLESKSTDESLSISGWDLASSDTSPFESNDPYLLLALGIVGLAIGAALFLGKMRQIARIAAIVAGIAVIGVVLRDWMSAASLVEDKGTSDTELKQAFGFFVPIVGGVLLAVGGVLPAKK